MTSSELGLFQRHELRQGLNLNKKIALRELDSLRQKLRHPEYPNMAKGFDGMGVADRVLREHNACGVLIGGLSEAVWNKRRTKEELAKHKDVDVLVLEEDSDIGKFEGGIDWWLPREGKVREYSAFIPEEIDKKVRWYENAMNSRLSFGAESIMREFFPLTSGLYIPGSEWVVDMRESEAMAYIDSSIEMDYGVIDALRNRLRKTIKTRLPKFISKTFKGKILSLSYGMMNNLIQLSSFDLDTLRQINKIA